MHPESALPLDQPCPGCGAVFPAVTGAVHPYMLSTPGCFAAFGEVLAREYEDHGRYDAAHHFTVDAYALQHPGDLAEPRAIRSVWLHYAALFVVFEQGATQGRSRDVMRALAGRAFDAPERPPATFAVTVRDARAAGTRGHVTAAARWARCAYDAWAPLRAPTRDLLSDLRLA